MTQFRDYCFTINNDNYDDMDNVLALEADYLCFGFEVGSDTETKHIQGYVHFNNRIRFPKLKKLLPRAHIERCKGNPEQNIKYCLKDGEFYEFGIRPRGRGRASWEKIEEAFNDPTSNPQMIHMYKKTYSTIKQMQLKTVEVDTKFYVIDPVCDAIGEIDEYFGGLDDTWVIITNMSQLAYYEHKDPLKIIFYVDFFEKEYNLWPRKVPILYKFGYEWIAVKPEILVVVSNTPSLYVQYKNI